MRRILEGSVVGDLSNQMMHERRKQLAVFSKKSRSSSSLTVMQLVFSLTVIPSVSEKQCVSVTTRIAVRTVFYICA
jgi:hypothetical protein